MSKDHDAVNHPKHYTSHPSGVECIQITEHMGFNLGNALKYIWRADLKGDAIEDLKKARWYIERELEKREGKPADGATTTSDAFDDASWIEWKGGEQPVPYHTVVEVLSRGNILGRAIAGKLNWLHLRDMSDIVRYRIAKTY